MSTAPCLVENPTTPTIEYPIGTSAATSISFVTLGAIAVFGPSLFWVLMDWDRESYTAIQLVHDELFTLRLMKAIALPLVQKASWKYHLVSSVLPN